MIANTSTAIVVDNGSGTIKGGFAGDFAPRTEFQTVVGKPKNPAIIVGGDNKDNYVGEETTSKQGVLKLSYPISHGNITAWHDMIKVWHHCFYTKLLAEIAEQPLLITETANAPASMKLQMANIFFETFNCPAVYFMPTNILALYSMGKTTGLVLDSGHDVTTAMPIYEGYAIKEAIQTELYGGKAIEDRLMSIYEKQVNSMRGNTPVASKIKINECSVLDHQGTVTKQSSTLHYLPDGHTFALGKELHEVPEQMFNPVEGGYTKRSVQHMLQDAIKECDEGLRREMTSNCVVVGGNTHMHGYLERLQDEAKAVIPHINIEIPQQIEYPTWVGGSLFASLSTFSNVCINRDEYMKNGGDQVVFRKCLL